MHTLKRPRAIIGQAVRSPSEALGAVELRWRHRNRGRRRLDRGCRKGTHITLTAEAYKLHVQISAGGVKDGADANKVAIVHQTASTNFGEMERHGVKDGNIHSLPPTSGARVSLATASSSNGA